MDRRRTRHRLTRLGIQVMLIGAFGILGGSLNGLNLLIVVAAVVLATLVVQWRMSRAMIDALRIDRRMPTEAFAGKPVRIRYQVNNENRLMPLWLIRLEDSFRRIDSSEPERTATGVGLLMPGQSTSTFFDVIAYHRGRYQLGRWSISTVAPLALSKAYRDSVREEDYLDVYPKLLPLRRSWRRMLPSRIGNDSSSAARQGPSDALFFGLREYRHGDSPRHIHWRTTARIGEPFVRQFEQQRRYHLCLLVDAWSSQVLPNQTMPSQPLATGARPQGARPDLVGVNGTGGGDAMDDRIDAMAERAISLTASITIELFYGHQNQIMLVVAGKQPVVVGSNASASGLRRMLQSLARVQLGDQASLDDAMSEAATVAKRLPDIVVISPRSQASAVADGAISFSSIKLWKSRSQLLWVDVTQKDFHRWVADGEVSNP